jgi:oxalate decarboxylase/phosphoglucose isomerase-like protein (cupin superfamily)
MKRRVNDKLRAVPYSQVKPLLDAKQEVDPNAGIIIVPLTDIVPKVGSKWQIYRFYAARVLPYTAVNPHYHLVGIEPYRFLSGHGVMNIGTIENGEVIWSANATATVKPKKFFLVNEGRVHSFRNTGAEPVDFLFACPDSHLKDAPEGDRYFTKDMKNGTTPA